MRDPQGSTVDKQHAVTAPNEALDNTLKPSPPIIRNSSPHDAVLAQMRGLPNSVDSSMALHADHHLQAAKSVDGSSPSPISYSTVNNPTGTRELLHDPFDGSPLGLLVSSDSQVHQPQKQDDTPGDVPVPECVPKEELWVHLSRVLELQNQVAKMHLEMEAVGPSDGRSKAAGRGRARRKSKGQPGSSDHTDNIMGVVRGISKDVGLEDVPEGDEEGVEVAGDEEAENKKAREAAFASLADQFEGRNESINAIMGKLDLLSEALTEFHALQAPMIEFPRSSPRQNTTPNATPPTIHSKPSIVTSPSLQNTGPPPNPNLLHPSAPSSGGSLAAAPLPPPRSNVIPASLSRTAAPSKKARNLLPPLIIDAVEPGKQTHVMESPASMGGSGWKSKAAS